MTIPEFYAPPEQSFSKLNDESVIQNIKSTLSYLFDLIFDIMSEFVQFLRSFKFFGDVSYFDFFVALIVMSVVITYLLNVARNPGVETTSTTRARERRKQNEKAYKESLNNRDKK